MPTNLVEGKLWTHISYRSGVGWAPPGYSYLRYATWIVPPQPNQVMGPMKKNHCNMTKHFWNILYTSMNQKFCNILVVYASLWFIDHIPEAIQAVEGTCYGKLCFRNSNWAITPWKQPKKYLLYKRWSCSWSLYSNQEGSLSLQGPQQISIIKNSLFIHFL